MKPHMKIYVVEARHSYENGEIVGVFSTMEAALARLGVVKSKKVYDYVTMKEFILDEPVSR